MQPVTEHTQRKYNKDSWSVMREGVRQLLEGRESEGEREKGCREGGKARER